MLDDLARRTAKAIVDLPSNFMLDRATYEYGKSIGYDGLDFYVCGRGGVLGDVDAGVVSACFVFFNPVMIRQRWQRGVSVRPAEGAACEFAGCLYRWSEAHLGSGIDYDTLAGLLGRVVEGASSAGAPLFAGWRTLPPPEPAPLLAMHHLNALRELRGALHGGAVLAVGLDPLVALLVKTPFMAGVFGWEEPYPDIELAREAWAEAEAATDRALGHAFCCLSKAEQGTLAELLERMHAGVH